MATSKQQEPQRGWFEEWWRNYAVMDIGGSVLNETIKWLDREIAQEEREAELIRRQSFERWKADLEMDYFKQKESLRTGATFSGQVDENGRRLTNAGYQALSVEEKARTRPLEVYQKEQGMDFEESKIRKARELKKEFAAEDQGILALDSMRAAYSKHLWNNVVSGGKKASLSESAIKDKAMEIIQQSKYWADWDSMNPKNQDAVIVNTKNAIRQQANVGVKGMYSPEYILSQEAKMASFTTLDELNEYLDSQNATPDDIEDGNNTLKEEIDKGEKGEGGKAKDKALETADEETREKVSWEDKYGDETWFLGADKLGELLSKVTVPDAKTAAKTVWENNPTRMMPAGALAAEAVEFNWMDAGTSLMNLWDSAKGIFGDDDDTMDSGGTDEFSQETDDVSYIDNQDTDEIYA